MMRDRKRHVDEVKADMASCKGCIERRGARRYDSVIMEPGRLLALGSAYQHGAHEQEF